MAKARTLNVLIIHGIGWGDSGKDYARPLQNHIQQEFERALTRLHLRDINQRDASGKRALRFEAVYWSPVTQDPENALLDLLGFGGFRPFRRFNLTYVARRQMVGLLGDVIAYEYGPDRRVYTAIHRRVDDCIDKLSDASADERDDAGYAPLTVIGHSLGSVIASDFVWDHTRDAPQPHYLTDHHLALKNMILMGSPVALYALRDNPSEDKEKLAASLDSPVQVDPEGGLWLNLVDPQDPIAFPLQPIRSYDRAGVIDCQVRAGSWLTTWNPASHVGYWRSAEVAELIGHKLALDWAALNSPRFAERYLATVEKFRADLRER